MTNLLVSLLLATMTLVLLVGVRLPPGFAVDPFPSRLRRSVALAGLVLTLAIGCFAPLLEYPTADPNAVPPDLPLGALFLGHALLASFLFGWWWLAGRPPVGAFLHLRLENSWNSVRAGVAAGVVGWALTLTTMAVVGGLAETLEPAMAPQSDEVPAVMRMIVELAWYERLLLVLSAGIVEEAFFRSFLQARTGLVFSSLLFTTSHMSYGLPLMLVGVFAVSAVFGVVFRRHHDVLPCMVAHAVFDAIQLFLVLPVVAAGR